MKKKNNQGFSISAATYPDGFVERSKTILSETDIKY